MGDLNCEPSERFSSENYSFVNLVMNPASLKSDNPNCIVLILTNNKNNCQKTNTMQTGLSDFHAMIVTMLKGGFTKQGSKIINYMD